MSKTKECRACFNEIDTRASVCSYCGTPQSKLKALSLYGAGIAGLIALIASATTYLYSQHVEARNSRNPISILTFVYKKGAVFLNSSRDPVYIRSVDLLGDNAHVLMSEEIQTVVEGKNFKKHNRPTEDFMLLPTLENRQKHWSEAWEGKSVCFDVLALSDRAWLDKSLTETVIGQIRYVKASDGQVVETDISMKAALLLKDKPECGSFGNPGAIFR